VEISEIDDVAVFMTLFICEKNEAAFSQQVACFENQTAFRTSPNCAPEFKPT
jgi:hypothetical protein